jgi:hypothetical protein
LFVAWVILGGVDSKLRQYLNDQDNIYERAVVLKIKILGRVAALP